MKLSTSLLLLAASVVSASPTPTLKEGVAKVLAKRASITDAANIGFATQNGGTKGGAGGPTTTVSTLPQLSAAANSTGPLVIVVQGSISGAAKVVVASDKTIVGKTGSSLTGIGFTILGQKNVIVRNMKIAKVLAAYGDGVTIQKSLNVWVDHCDFSGDETVGKDTYDGLVDLSHAADFVTISHSYFHNHSKGTLVGHTDKNAAEDTGHLRVTYANNHFYKVASRGPLLRFGTAHILNNYYEEQNTGVNTRMGAQALVQSTVFENSGKKMVYTESSAEEGYAVVIDTLFGGQSANTAPVGTLSASSFTYAYTPLGSANVKAAVTKEAGQTLAF
ncbi:polysaccharide lyase family 1 protein [Dothidotthia symphoricarpi CBS 119687]|uniref:Polysaccharide lyase family 1 protein n=1 Tax=Dothidotthia symphoricarpi CBS 119687 TaxID=1392245 RepID=A0A6A6A8S0_9PLEO|nr:polysaccharide lyase family 1 protein [Dothidotthia symphoricarpi CBS 119687]KAF2127573.1 polysaccharide lyase family 1 protein [Dothidotthia symphoricarpi CBS 119687]